jgi:hypothetical protein
VMKQKHDPRSLAALSFRQIGDRYPHYARILIWLWSCWLIRRENLWMIGWPEGTTRQNRNHGLQQLLDHALIEAIDEQHKVFKLGRRGARLLQEAGIPAHYRATPKPRAQPGLLLAGEFAVALGRQLMQHRHIRAMTWLEQPFAGSTVRPDGTAELRYTLAPRADASCNYHILKTQHARGPAQDEYLIKLCIEIDRVTQFADKLEDRIKNWAAALHNRVEVPEQTSLIVLWITNGTWRRARTIQQLWVRTTGQAALFTTVYQLRHESEDLPMDPLGEIWMDGTGAGVRGYSMFDIALAAGR